MKWTIDVIVILYINETSTQSDPVKDNELLHRLFHIHFSYIALCSRHTFCSVAAFVGDYDVVETAMVAAFYAKDIIEIK